MDYRAQFADAIRAAGLTPPDSIEPGTFHRFPGIGKRNGNAAGWCKLFADGMGGSFGDFSHDFAADWQVKRERPATLAEREGFRQQVEKARAEAESERARRHAEARELAAKRYNAARPADAAHPYLDRKGVKPHGIRQEGDLLLVPMRDGDGLHSLQTIDAEGQKRYLPGGRVAGCYHSFGKPGPTVCIAEGYATGATIYESTGYPVAVAFDAGNLEAVARTLRGKMPGARIILCADDDAATTGNPGLTKARAAARAIGGLVAAPDFGGNRPEGATDFNDLARHLGAEAVRVAVDHARAPDVPEPQPGAPDATAADSGPRVELLCAADVVPVAVRWLWSGWLAAGKLHILAGPAGTGKTTLALAIAATITNAGRWPDKSRATGGDVVIWSGEDGIDDTLTPRLIVNDANVARVRFVRSVTDEGGKRQFDPARDVPMLVLALTRMTQAPALLIVDPIVSAVAGDSHKNSETRRALQPLVDLGERIGCAILGISHFSKGTSGRDPVERVTGSIAFGALARLVLAAVKTTTPEGDPGPRLFARAKSNLGPDGGGFHYSLDQFELTGSLGIEASRVMWGDPVEGEARALLAAAEVEADADECAATDDAKSWLVATLADAGGSMDLREVRNAAKRAGFPERTIYRARHKAGIQAKPAGFGASKRSVWTIGDGTAAAANTANAPITANPANRESVAAMAVLARAGSNDDAGEVF